MRVGARGGLDGRFGGAAARVRVRRLRVERRCSGTSTRTVHERPFCATRLLHQASVEYCQRIDRFTISALKTRGNSTLTEERRHTHTRQTDTDMLLRASCAQRGAFPGHRLSPSQSQWMLADVVRRVDIPSRSCGQHDCHGQHMLNGWRMAHDGSAVGNVPWARRSPWVPVVRPSSITRSTA